MTMRNDGLGDLLEKVINELEDDRKKPGFIQFGAEQNVPTISFPGFNKEECERITKICQEVLRHSRNNNHQEVAMIYEKDESNIRIKTIGDKQFINLNNNPNYIKLINDSQNKDLVIICIHNHPSSSPFSITDMMFFASNPSIKIMEVLNANGQASFLYRNDKESIIKPLFDMLDHYIPDDMYGPGFSGRIKNALEDCDKNDRAFQFSNYFTKDEIKYIYEKCKTFFKDNNIIQSQYISKGMEQNIMTLFTDKYNGSQIVMSNNSLSADIQINSLNEEVSYGFEPYEENGEDGYFQNTDGYDEGDGEEEIGD